MSRIVLLLILFIIQLDARPLDEVLSSKTLKVAMRPSPSTYMLDNEKEVVSGFNYELAEDFAKYLGVKMELVPVKVFREYWKKDGEFIFKMKPPVTPDIFKKTDITLDIISVNEKRQKHVTMVPYLENKTIVFTNKNTKIEKVEDLIGKKIFLFKGFQSQYKLEKIFKEKNIPYTSHEFEYDNVSQKIIFDKEYEFKKDAVNIVLLQGKKMAHYFFVYLSVHDKSVDAATADAFALFLRLHQYEYLKNEILPSFALDEEMGYLSATMPKEHPKLSEAFADFMKQYRENGNLSKLMKKHINVDLELYTKILKYDEN